MTLIFWVGTRWPVALALPTHLSKTLCKRKHLEVFLATNKTGARDIDSLFWEHLPGTWGPLFTPRGSESGSSYLRSQWWQEFFPFLPLPSFLTSFLSLLLMLSTSVSRPWCIWACLTWWGQDGFSLPKETGVIIAVRRRTMVLPLLQTSRSTCLQLFAWETPYVWTEFIKQCV